MLQWLPLTRYQVRQIRGYSAIAAAALVIILILGNVITAMVRDSITIDEKSYTMKKGFPIITSAQDYIRLVKNYPYNPGVKLRIHTMRTGETYWDLVRTYKVSIDTLIGANPFITSLISGDHNQIVIPSQDGLLFAFDDFFDVGEMKDMLKYKGTVSGSYLPTPFKIFSTDDIRLVFFKNAKPLVVNNSIASLYKYRNIFQKPVKGNYSSLYGERVDPFFHGLTKFHNGIDIIAPMRSPIKPTRDGMVIFTGWRAGYGKAVMVQHYDGYTTLYGHCCDILVKKGDWVKKADTIGLVGSTGRATGPHLHFTIMKHGRELNPLPFIW